YIIALDSSGNELGRHRLKQPHIEGLAIGLGETLYFTNQSNMLYAIDGIGREKWQFNMGRNSTHLPSVAADGTIYMTHSNKLLAISPQGKEKWQIDPKGAYHTRSATLDAQGRVYLHSASKLSVYNADGTLAWQHDDNKVGAVSYVLIGADGRVYRVSNRGIMATNSNGTELWHKRIESLKSVIIGKNGHLYILHDNKNMSVVNSAGQLMWQHTFDFELGNHSNVTMDRAGILTVADKIKTIHAIRTDSGGVANSAWPMRTQNNRNTMQVSYHPSSENDTDGDGITNEIDNCPLNFNPDQLDFDGDADINGGDSCDNDDDNDGVIDILDAFEFDATESLDTDGDGVGNNVDTDDDGDGYPDDVDQLPLDATEHLDTDGDGIGNNADQDDDGDSMSDSFEQANGLNSDDPSDAGADNDGDGFTNLEEYLAQTDASDANYYPQGPGTVKWSYSQESNAKNHGAALLGTDGLVYFADDYGYIQVLNTLGELVRSTEVTDKDFDGDTWPGVMDAQKNIYFVDTLGRLSATDANGEKKWHRTVGGLDNYTTSITLGPNGTLYCGTKKGKIQLFDQQGLLLKTIETSEKSPMFGRIIVLPNGTIYATDGKGLVAFDSEGTKLWRHELSISSYRNNRVHLALGTKGEIYLTTLEGYVHAFNPQGAIVWSFYFGTDNSSNAVSYS
ncbi:MAG: PQQ-binding-like beta-propeller repeat protein, partial [Psychrosphaera sp.]|nr:PQQ-binding-like beta-propeller repeat protein [Psychrosphaera sp.]